MEATQRAALLAGCARGFTVLCTVRNRSLLLSLAALAGPTGLVIAAGLRPSGGAEWSAVRCDPAQALPLRSHVVDAAVLAADEGFARAVEEVRRALAPGGDVRVSLDKSDESTAIETALEAAAIRPVRRDPSGVLVCRGP